MKLLKLDLTHFGKFHNKTIPFHPGLNVIYGKNEAGKTTIHAFIRAMLFGLSDSDKERYRPWKEEGGFCGTLYLEKEGITYRIERDFEMGTLQVTNHSEDIPMDSSQEALDELLAPMTQENFDNILHISQMQDRFFPQLTASYRKDQEQLAASLQEVREALLTQEKEIEECKEDVTSTVLQLKELEAAKQKHAEEWEASYQAYQTSLREKEAQVEALYQELATKSGGKAIRKGSYSISILFLFFAIICGAFYFYCSELNLVDFIPYTIYGAAGACGLALITFLVQLILNKRKKRLFELQKKAEAANEELEGLVAEKPVPDTAFQAECIEKRQEMEEYVLQVKEHLEDVQACMRENMTLYHNLQQDRKSNRIEELSHTASLLFASISGEASRSIQLKEDGSLVLLGEEKPIPLQQASRGTADQVYFCLRLAAADLLGKEDAFPIFLDDVFAFYDDERLDAILKLLKTRNNQVVLFTCHKRESSILSH